MSHVHRASRRVGDFDVCTCNAKRPLLSTWWHSNDRTAQRDLAFWRQERK